MALGTLPADLDQIGAAYIGAATKEIEQWVSNLPEKEPIGVCFSGGIDSGSVFVLTYHVLRKLGDTPVGSSPNGESSRPTSRVALESVKIVPADSIK